MEEGDVEGGKSDGDGDKGGRATKRVRASKRATKTKRKKEMAWCGWAYGYTIMPLIHIMQVG